MKTTQYFRYTRQRPSFATTTRGLDRSLPPMRLYEKAKRLGIWNPSEIDLTKDKSDWVTLRPDEKDLILRLLAMFMAGEEAVTLDLLNNRKFDFAGGKKIEETILPQAPDTQPFLLFKSAKPYLAPSSLLIWR